MNIGFIGLGIMGAPMAGHLQAAGFNLFLWARRPETTAPFVEKGAVNCDSIGSLASQVDIIVLNVSDTCDVESLCLDDNGILHTAKPGTVVIDHSTICPDATKRIAATLLEKDIHLVDAPVSGGDIGAQQGILSIMVGASQAAFEKALPLFECYGKNIVHVGDQGAGQFCKACNQIMVAQTIAAVGETLLFAESVGVDPAKVREALLGGFAQSRILDVHGQRILDNNFAPGFKSKLHDKDMKIALGAAQNRGLNLQGAELAASHIEAMQAAGLGEEDSVAMFKLFRDR
jgi:2-hydroxy-3-oxopropionate reductase